MELANTLSQDGESRGGIQRVAFPSLLLLPKQRAGWKPFPPLTDVWPVLFGSRMVKGTNIEDLKGQAAKIIGAGKITSHILGSYPFLDQ